MSDERLDLRRLPPVEEKVERPARLSQTLLKHADRCPRAAFLYLKHRGGGASHAMDRGSLFHAVAERMVVDLIRAGEATLYAPGATQGRDGEVLEEGAAAAAREVASVTAALVEEVADERPDLVVPSHEMDATRIMAYHLAMGLDVDPATVAGIERKFVLDLPNGWTVSGKIDLLFFLNAVTIGVDDYKTSLAVPDQEGFANSFQTKLYACLAMFGFPVSRVGCEACAGTGRVFDRDCEVCAGRGTVEVREEPIGREVRYARGREIYPRAKPQEREDGSLRLVARDAVWSRTDLQDFLHDVARIAERVGRGLDTGDWPARHGTHCSECPSEPECPLPAKLRRYAGAVNTVDQASEALEWALRMGARVEATKKEVREFAKAHGDPIPVGADQVWDFVTSFQRSLKRRGKSSDWDGLEQAVLDTARYGAPFDLREWVREGHKTEFKKRPLLPGEAAAVQIEEGAVDGGDDRGAERGEGGGDAGSSSGADAGGGGSRFGDEPPF